MPSTNFQGQVTNAINTVGILAGLTGIPQERKELKTLDKTLEAAAGMKDEITKKMNDANLPEEERNALEKTVGYINNQLEARSEKIAELRPSTKNLQNLMDAYTATGRNRARLQTTRNIWEQAQEEREAYEAIGREIQQQWGSFGEPPRGNITVSGFRYDDEKANQANERSQKQAKARQARRNFVRDYLPKIETGFGGTVGDFSKETQRELGKNYSTKERKEIMDRMDNEKKNKGGKK